MIRAFSSRETVRPAKIQGAPRAPRPIMTAAQPVARIMARASSWLLTSPLPVTGIPTASTTEAMISQGARPENCCEPRDLDRIHRAVVPAAADLDREGHADRLPQSAEDQQGGERVAHEGGALTLGDDLRDGAAHVEVDRVGAAGLEPSRRLGQDIRVRAQQLHRDRVLLVEVARERNGG